MTSPIAEIRAFIAENRTSDALARLLDMSQGNKQIHDSILMVLAEYNDLNAQRLRGTVSSEEAVLRHNKVNEKVLMALDAFDSQGKVLPGSVRPTTNEKSSSGRGGVFVLALLTIGFAILLTLGTYARHDASQFIGMLLGGISFIGLIIALIVSASKSK